jgi:hypothetical protein
VVLSLISGFPLTGLFIVHNYSQVFNSQMQRTKFSQELGLAGAVTTQIAIAGKLPRVDLYQCFYYSK